MHQGIFDDYLLEAWDLLMNGIYLFMARELGLGGIHELLGYVVMHNLYPNIFVSQKRNYFSSEILIGDHAWY